jgi:hypothetical protein
MKAEMLSKIDGYNLRENRCLRMRTVAPDGHGGIKYLDGGPP